MKKTKCVECEKKDAEISRLRKKSNHQHTFELGKQQGYENAIKAMIEQTILLVEKYGE